MARTRNKDGEDGNDAIDSHSHSQHSHKLIPSHIFFISVQNL